jgi:hypothetical protein
LLAPGMTTNRPWSVDLSLEQMQKFRIGVAILSDDKTIEGKVD